MRKVCVMATTVVRVQQAVTKGGKEEVHGCVESYISANGQDNEQIPSYCDQVHPQEDQEEDVLLLWLL